MPILMLAVVGGVLGLLIFQWGRITGEKLLAVFYAVSGALLGVILLTRLAASTGPVGAVLSAVAGAVVVLYLARISGKRDDK